MPASAGQAGHSGPSAKVPRSIPVTRMAKLCSLWYLSRESMSFSLCDTSRLGSLQLQAKICKSLTSQSIFHGLRRHCQSFINAGPKHSQAPSKRQAVLRYRQEDSTDTETSESAAAEKVVAPTLQPEHSQYNWREQWYPIHYARDVPEGEPQRAWLFDEPIVIARRPGKGPIALIDRCPHRAAALSEGRMTSSGNLQCAYHGWTFNGETGDCVNIPQVSHGGTISGRTCATALPCVERQGILWVYPSPDATDPPVESIAGLPELDQPGWTSDDFVRDFPIDFTLLLENLSDPDHGLFAHQTPNFDSFAASAEFPMQVSTEQGRGGPKVVGRVPGVLKLTKKEADKEKVLYGEEGKPTDVVATMEFEPPTHVRWARYDASGKTRFIASFYCTPAGFGRTRMFIRYARSIAPWLHPPRWLFSIGANYFVDQDSYLVATQQEVTLAAELAAHKASLAQKEEGRASHNGNAKAGNGASGLPTGATGLTRRQIFCHRSPTDNMLVAIGRWMDEAIPLVPNRYQAALQASVAGVEGSPAVHIAPREQILDRYSSHTMLCPDSMAAYRNAQKAHTLLSIAAGLGGAALVSYAAAASATGTLQGGLLAKWGIACALLAGLASAAKALAGQFVYVYTRDKQSKDLKRITNFVADK